MIIECQDKRIEKLSMEPYDDIYVWLKEPITYHSHGEAQKLILISPRIIVSAHQAEVKPNSFRIISTRLDINIVKSAHYKAYTFNHLIYKDRDDSNAYFYSSPEKTIPLFTLTFDELDELYKHIKLNEILRGNKI